MAQVARLGFAAAGGAIALAVCVAASVSGPQARAVAALDSTPVRAAAGPPPRPALDLDLVGVVEAGGASTAIIAERGGGQKTYGVGDAVRPGLSLERITSDSVVLADGEARYRLPLRRTVAAVAANDSSMDAPKPDNGFGALKPYPGGGMRVEGVSPGSRYAKLGLRTGDVLLSVNRVALESPQQLTRLYRVRRFASQEVELLRDGRFETLRFDPS